MAKEVIQMSKKIIILVVSILVIGVNVFAQGDLIVNGEMGVGTTVNTNSKLIVSGDLGNSIHGLLSTDATSGAKRAFFGKATSTNSSPSSLYLFGLNARSEWKGSADHTGSIRGGNYIFIGEPTATATLNEAMGVYVDVSLQSSNGSTVTDMYGFYMKSVANFDNITNLYGIYLPAISGGSNNYGIVLDGDGAGSDIVFGDDGLGNRPRIFSDNGYLKAQDVRGNITQFSPHDPETGEWIFYSKNTKTGKTVRVNMEKMVKAIEKLTGEKFMVETMETIE